MPEIHSAAGHLNRNIENQGSVNNIETDNSKYFNIYFKADIKQMTILTSVLRCVIPVVLGQ